MQLQQLFFSLIAALTFVLFERSEAWIFAVDSGYIKVNKRKIFCETSGKVPAIIMIHDGLLHRETWDAQFSSFWDSLE